MKTLRVVLSKKILRAVLCAGLAFSVTGTSATAQEQGLKLGGKVGNANAAWFNFPQGVAVDAGGDLYVADSYNNVVRKVTPAGVITTIAGSEGISGSIDGTGSDARFYFPQSITVDSAGNLFVADSWNYTIRKITPSGVVSTLAGSPGIPGGADGNAKTAKFGYISGVAVDAKGNVFVADVWNKSIRKISPDGMVTTLAGSAGMVGSSDGIGREAHFGYLSGLAIDIHGNLYVPDVWDKTIRKVTPTGMVTTLAGVPGQAGSLDGTGGHAEFKNPLGITVDRAGNVYIADQDTIRKLTPNGMVSTLAGCSGNQGIADGWGKAARFGSPVGLASDAIGDVYVADSGNYAIRKVSCSGVVTTLAGNSAARVAEGFQLINPVGGLLDNPDAHGSLSSAGGDFPGTP